MKSEVDAKKRRVLLIEDGSGDVRLTKEAFREANLSVDIDVASDGIEAMVFLKKTLGDHEAGLPEIILLDLNLPKMDGREVLAQIKEDPRLRLIPTIILTTSTAEADIRKAYELRANCYLTKPVQLEDFEELVRSINDFWLEKAQLTAPGHPS
ncbi:response regulator [Terriglobus roseus]|uniref:CheY chemotaxis protein or a CheY-like REC (Receiver) domain n=1 Tax=Terriglobus roseus TaxID=392734 RepID=A0A1H4RRP7_9BACT|nr:response regulator [Terriglobus roseus]SEC34560.1 CheY chemotaxis protein or a CheY-like REC (receiver) domain [Terriglobus roseus]